MKFSKSAVWFLLVAALAGPQLAAAQTYPRGTSVGLDPVTNTPAEFGKFLRAEMEKWARVSREANIRVE